MKNWLGPGDMSKERAGTGAVMRKYGVVSEWQFDPCFGPNITL